MVFIIAVIVIICALNIQLAKGTENGMIKIVVFYCVIFHFGSVEINTLTCISVEGEDVSVDIFFTDRMIVIILIVTTHGNRNMRLLPMVPATALLPLLPPKGQNSIRICSGVGKIIGLEGGSSQRRVEGWFVVVLIERLLSELCWRWGWFCSGEVGEESDVSMCSCSLMVMLYRLSCLDVSAFAMFAEISRPPKVVHDCTIRHNFHTYSSAPLNHEYLQWLNPTWYFRRLFVHQHPFESNYRFTANL